MSGRSSFMLVIAAVAGLVAFGWPLFVTPDIGFSSTLAPMVFAMVLPLVLAVVLSELSGREMDAKALAMLGVLTAVGAVLRPLGTGTVGMEPIFFLLILGGHIFGPGFGFAQGALTLFASALLTGGVGPWLPYQMLAAGFVGLGAGFIPRSPGARGQRVALAWLGVYAFGASFAFGWLMDFAFWPFGIGPNSQFSFDPASGPLANLHTFVLYNVVTSMGWNLGRALTSVALLVLLGPGLLHILQRAARKSSFGTAPETVLE